MVRFQEEDRLLILQECMLGFGSIPEANNELAAWCWYKIIQDCKS